MPVSAMALPACGINSSDPGVADLREKGAVGAGEIDASDIRVLENGADERAQAQMIDHLPLHKASGKQPSARHVGPTFPSAGKHLR